MTSTMSPAGLRPQDGILGRGGRSGASHFGAGLGKGEMSGWKINTSLSGFFFSFESKNISWFFMIRNMLGVFFGQQPVKYHFPVKGMQGPFARRAKAFQKNKIKTPSF